MVNVIILFTLSFLLTVLISYIFGLSLKDDFAYVVTSGWLPAIVAFSLGGFLGFIFNFHKVKDGDSHLRYIMPQIYFSLFFYLIILFYNMILASA